MQRPRQEEAETVEVQQGGRSVRLESETEESKIRAGGWGRAWLSLLGLETRECIIQVGALGGGTLLYFHCDKDKEWGLSQTNSGISAPYLKAKVKNLVFILKPVGNLWF